MKFNIPQGISLSSQLIVGKEHLASHTKGKLDVISTIAIIKFMEDTCIELVESKLPVGYETVSVEINVKHISPAHENDAIVCNACLKYVDDRRLFFEVAVLDSEKLFSRKGQQHQTRCTWGG